MPRFDLGQIENVAEQPQQEITGIGDDPDLLGYYDGVALTERDTTYGGVLPDRIVVIRSTTLDMCETEEELVEEVRITVVHEVAHHFGIGDARLHDLGYA